MGRLFGTDGIRGIFNQEPITEEMGYRWGGPWWITSRGKVVIQELS